jgi:hypothetical protein
LNPLRVLRQSFKSGSTGADRMQAVIAGWQVAKRAGVSLVSAGATWVELSALHCTVAATEHSDCDFRRPGV